MIGQRIKQLRLARGLSLDALAAEMGGIVTKQAISKYERGLTNPSCEVINKMAVALGVKATHLWEEPAVSVEFIAYRKKSRFPKKEQERIENNVRQSLEERIALQDLLQQDNGFDLPVKELQVKTLEDADVAAADLRQRWQLGLDPIASVVDVLEEHQIHVLEMETSDKFDGISAVAYDDEKQKKAAAVVTRAGLPGERQRLNFAHELGHLVLDVSPECDEEKAAFRFGAAFLASADVIRREVGLQRGFIQPQELLLLKRRFGMSIQALLYRLRDLDIITEAYYRQWCIDISRLGWRKREPSELPSEQPTWLRQSAWRAFSEGLVSREDIQGMFKEEVEVEESLQLVQRHAFMKLPLEERRRILAEQAEKLAPHYQEDSEVEDIGGGDFVDY